MLSEKIRNLLSTWMAGYARGLVDECADEAAKLERVARAADALRECKVHDMVDFWRKVNVLFDALADLPDDAL